MSNLDYPMMSVPFLNLSYEHMIICVSAPVEKDLMFS